MTHSRYSVRLIAATAMCGLALTSAPFALAPQPAAAQPQTAPASIIDADATGTLTIHKRLNPTTFGEPSGNASDGDGVSGTALAGAKFTVQRVNVDITTNEGFATARALTPETAAGQLTGDPTTVTTNDEGVAAFPNLPVGVYYVTENTEGLKDADGKAVLPSKPFLVFLPMTNPADTTQWNYNPHIFPKNTSVGATKDVTDDQSNVGDTITFTLLTDIPTVQEGKPLVKYVITDALPADDVTVTQSGIVVKIKDGEAFTAGTDYTLTVGDDQKVVITFTEAGLEKLAAQGGKQVETTIPVVVKAVGDGELAIKNTATVVTNNGGADSETETNETITYIGKLKVVKHEHNATDKKLEGAVFQIYRCTNKDTLTSDALSVGGATEWTTNGEGELLIDGLHVTDFADNEDSGGAQYKYCLVETKAPAGYELLAEPVEVNFTRADVTNAEDGTDAVTQLATVANVTKTSTNLPSTGGAGVGILMAIGAAIVGVGAWFARRASKDTAAAE